MVFVASFVASTALAPLADVRVGERGDRVRIEVLCTQSCDAEPLGERSYLVTWAKGDFVADVGGKSRHIQTIRLQTQQFGTALQVEAASPPRSVIVNRCGTARICFDYDFSAPDGARSPALTVEQLEHDLTSLMSRTGYDRLAVNAAPAPVAKRVVSKPRPSKAGDVQPPKPAKPEPAKIAAAPVEPPAVSANATPAPAPAPSPRPVLVQAAASEQIGVCAAARAALEIDAWNLGAYRTVELCDRKARGSQDAGPGVSGRAPQHVTGTALR
ncbi:MAG: hypothetical protein ACWA5T_00755 [Parvularcula sp.]